MPDSPSRGRSPETPWEPQPRAPRASQPSPGYPDDRLAGSDPRAARDQRTRRGGAGGPGGPGQGGAGPNAGGRRGIPVSAPSYDPYAGDEYDGYDVGRGGDGEPAGRSVPRRGGAAGAGSARGGSRSAAGAGSARSGSGRTETLSQRSLTIAACALVPTLVIAFLVHLLSGGGSSKSYAGIPLNMQLFKFMAVGFPMAVAAIAGVLKWRRIEPFGVTLGYGVVAGLSWLGLLFMMQVKGIIPHLPPLLSVPVIVGGAFAVAGVLTAESTSTRGRYACLAGVLLSHVAIVAIVVSIVLA